MPYEIELDPQKWNDMFLVKLVKDHKAIKFIQLPFNSTKEEIESASIALINEQESLDLEEPPELTPEEIAEQEAMEAVMESCVDEIEIGEKTYKVKKKYCQVEEEEPEEPPMGVEEIHKKKE
jgi:hypothetical protein